MLDVKSLTVFYENALALNGLTLEVRQGEIVGLFGSNSAGKTTLMNTIAGLTLDLKIKEERKGGERITVHGQVIYRGEEILESKPSDRVRKGIVLCRERHPVFRDSSVEENLKISGYLRQGRAAGARGSASCPMLVRARRPAQGDGRPSVPGQGPVGGPPRTG